MKQIFLQEVVSAQVVLLLAQYSFLYSAVENALDSDRALSRLRLTHASLKIRLNPDVFKITAEWKDYKVNKIVIRQTLKAKSVNAKQSKNLKFSASLKFSNGKAIVGKKIVFKFKGKKYVAKTNKKGIATIKIKKSVLKRLKVGKKYHISITYKNIDNGYVSVNNIAKTIKIIK